MALSFKPATIPLAKFKDDAGLPQFWALAIANHNYSRIVFNKEFDKRLLESNKWKSEPEIYPAWTGTYVVYTERDMPFGESVRCIDSNTLTSYNFDVPEKYQDKRNAILVVQHGFSSNGRKIITMEEDGNEVHVKIANQNNIILLPNFPEYSGWYKADNEYGIPLGTVVSKKDSSARYLLRGTQYCGFLARIDYIVGDVRKIVYASFSQSAHFGVLTTKDEAARNAKEFATIKNSALISV